MTRLPSQTWVSFRCAWWVDDHNQPRWYITVIVGVNNGCYEVRWEDDIFLVDPKCDEIVFQYNRNVMAFFQRHPDAISVTFADDVYLFASPDEQTVGGCLFGRQHHPFP